MPDPRAWEAIRELDRRVTEQGQSFSLTDEVRALLMDTSSDVAITPEEAERALLSEASAAELLKEIAKRIRMGSRRLSRALVDSARCQEAGDTEAARKLLMDVLAVEVVPHYREIIRTQLDALDDES
ncbi:DUSAM domain-containing protein [Pyxidicoccus xibeiensis]|uniref:DUSAM domain-containing protein n=1 Tax=Pyxidicoccus xibeiensis TaxID=2906759 RepID=UPI0020A7E76E|nr:DUSAM domain-containing protein [Pyxidicoccus xibeiensis]MCP3136738.1 DUSAM domain-containing protein [Pyxidicoccus xibeiensis]